MSPDGNDLIAAILDGNVSAANKALAAGAGVNGPPGLPYPPIVAATLANQAGIVEVLLEQGADADRPATRKVPSLSFGIVRASSPGERALHVAASSGNVKIVRLLLERARADVNATDDEGQTPLVVACGCQPQHASVEVVRLLLEAGADPVLASDIGCTPLHAVALKNGRIDLVDILYPRAPATLNCCSAEGATPLCLACAGGYESMVSRLLSLGAMQPISPVEPAMCPLTLAVVSGCVGVVRALVNEGGVRAVGGEIVLPKALHMAVRFHQARMLRLLLTMDGEERRSKWANTNILSGRLLHVGTACCYPAAVSVLLEAGADEAAYNSEGRIPLDVIGVDIGLDDGPQMGRGQEVAIRRMLQRGPAYRARSWAWPSDEEASAGGRGDGDTAAAVAAAAAAVLSSPPAAKTSHVSVVRVFRPKGNNNSKLFLGLVGRYCAKD